jgi:hypothetical protein
LSNLLCRVKHEVVAELVKDQVVGLVLIMDTENYDSKAWDTAMENALNWQLKGVDLEKTNVSRAIVSFFNVKDQHHWEQAAMKQARQKKLKCSLDYNYILQPCVNIIREEKSQGEV